MGKKAEHTKGATKWRYLQQYLDVHCHLAEELDHYGANGWEVALAIPWGGSLLVVFKRPLEEDQSEQRE